MTSSTHSTTPLSTDFRIRAIKAVVEDDQSCREVARRFKVAASTVIKWVAHFKETGSYERKPMGGDRHSHRIEEHAEAILARIEEEPGITLVQLQAWLKEEHGLDISHVAVWRFLGRHGITHKKKRQRPVNSNAPRSRRSASTG